MFHARRRSRALRTLRVTFTASVSRSYRRRTSLKNYARLTFVRASPQFKSAYLALAFLHLAIPSACCVIRQSPATTRIRIILTAEKGTCFVRESASRVEEIYSTSLVRRSLKIQLFINVIIINADKSVLRRFQAGIIIPKIEFLCFV